MIRVSLCQSCAFVREVKGRHGQRYLLCENPEIAAKYPAQPVLACPGFERGGGITPRAAPVAT
jgi:hypothetical protein